MTTITVEEFFRRYEQANSEFDVQLIAKTLRGDFHVREPTGCSGGEKGEFIKVLPRRKDFMKISGPRIFACRFSGGLHTGFQIHPGEDRLEYAFSHQQRGRCSPQDLSHLHSL